MYPVTRRKCACIHPIIDDQRRGAMGKHLLHSSNCRRKPAIVTNHEEGRIPMLTVVILDLLQLLFTDSQRLFNEHVFASPESLQNHAAMQIVPGGDHHQVHIGVSERSFVLGSRVASSKTVCCKFRICAGAAHYAVQLELFAELRKIWKVHGLRKTSGPG